MANQRARRAKEDLQLLVVKMAKKRASKTKAKRRWASQTKTTKLQKVPSPRKIKTGLPAKKMVKSRLKKKMARVQAHKAAKISKKAKRARMH